VNLKITAVSRREYTYVGSDNWVCQLPRPECDEALTIYLASTVKMPTKLCIEAFRNTPEFQQRAEDWSVVLGHLARLAKVDPDAVPVEVGVSLWGQAMEGRPPGK
jgi:hypothetical protein